MEPAFASRRAAAATTIRTPAEALAWLSSIIFALSSFMSWYTIEDQGLTLAVTGWHSGALGKLVFFLGFATVLLLILRGTGVTLPPAVPLGMAILALGAVGTILVLVRVFSIPDDFDGFGRSIGLWISLLSAIGIAVAGFLQGAEDV
jgi:hypothetical protein